MKALALSLVSAATFAAGIPLRSLAATEPAPAATAAKPAPAATAAVIPELPGLGAQHFKVTTESRAAQAFFDQGLRLVFGFNHGAAIKSFQEAARLDPDCAMAHWGIALAAGPHINFPFVPPPAAELAWAELALAQQHAAKATPVEQALIGALAKRYANPQPEDRSPLDRAYADAMREVWKQFPKEPHVGAFFAESLMDLRPWDQWTKEGEPQPGTEEVVATLDAVLKLDLNHPFANHLYIHAVEASPHPERADEAADRLRDLQPGLAHNVHMPSHIDIRRGRWQLAIDTNAKAIEADKARRMQLGPPAGFLPVYVAHNRHMLAWAAVMTGQRELAMQHLRAMCAEFPDDFMADFGLVVAEAWYATPIEVLVRFGRWDEVLGEPAPNPKYPYSSAFFHAARAVAHAAKGDTKAARAEQARFLEGAKKVPAEEIAAGNNLCSAVLAILTPMVDGEILVREGKVEEGLVQLRAAVAAEDQLKYDEPPSWMIPVRHALGAVLMNQGRHADAETVYREDLRRLPNNGWALYGLSESLRLQGKDKDAAPVRKQFDAIWAKADTPITSSCLCQPAP